MAGSFRLGKVPGFDVHIHTSWCLILLLLIWSLSTIWFAPGFIWTAFIGWVLLSAAQSLAAHKQTRSTLDKVRAGQIMQTHPLTAPATISLQKLISDYLAPNGQRTVLITQGTQGSSLTGLITLTDINKLPQERWAITPVGYVMRIREQIYSTTPEQPLDEVLQIMVSKDINQVPVVQNDVVVGMLNRESVVRYLQLPHNSKHHRPPSVP